MHAWRSFSVVLALASIGLACSSGGSKPAAAPCDQACRDGIALRGVREAMKLAFNLTLQGKPVGMHDETAPCPLGGRARIHGDATSNATQGATVVTLTYDLDHCAYLQKDADPTQTYSLTLTGSLTENGTLAVQPQATTAIEIASDSLSVTGTVGDPPVDYAEPACAVKVGQNGNQLSGTFCGRTTGLTL